VCVRLFQDTDSLRDFCLNVAGFSLHPPISFRPVVFLFPIFLCHHHVQTAPGTYSTSYPTDDWTLPGKGGRSVKVRTYFHFVPRFIAGTSFSLPCHSFSVSERVKRQRIFRGPVPNVSRIYYLFLVCLTVPVSETI
jgi:hypothetical protein